MNLEQSQRIILAGGCEPTSCQRHPVVAIAKAKGKQQLAQVVLQEGEVAEVISVRSLSSEQVVSEESKGEEEEGQKLKNSKTRKSGQV